MAEQKGLGSLQKTHIPPKKPFFMDIPPERPLYFQPGKHEALSQAMFEYIRNDDKRGLADVEFLADLERDQGFRPTFELGAHEMENLTGGDFGDIINVSKPQTILAQNKEGKIVPLNFGDPNLSMRVGANVGGTHKRGGERGIYKEGPFSSDSFDTEGNYLPNITINPDRTTFSRIFSDAMEGVTGNLSPEKFDELTKELYRPVEVSGQSGDESVTVKKSDANKVLGHEIGHLGQDVLEQHPLHREFLGYMNTFSTALFDDEFQRQVGGERIDDMEHAIIYAMDEGSKLKNQNKEPLTDDEKRNAKIFDTYMKLKDEDVTSQELLSYFNNVLNPEGGRLEGGFSGEQQIQMLRDMFMSGEAVAILALVSKKMADELLATKRERKRKGLASIVSDSKSTHGHSHD
tara:strand:- start:2757 stop:3968 length:1212 start_codon:yes stop_codon:yes gene_type:complete